MSGFVVFLFVKNCLMNNLRVFLALSTTAFSKNKETFHCKLCRIEIVLFVVPAAWNYNVFSNRVWPHLQEKCISNLAEDMTTFTCNGAGDWNGMIEKFLLLDEVHI